jgi:transglutaminase-like putative cysteine protease
MRANRYLPPRNSLLWLIAGLSLSMLPIARELPLWLTAIWLFVVLWRIQIFRGNWQLPSKLNKTVLVLVCVAGLFQSFGSMLGLEPMASLLCCALLLKLLEMQSRRDALLIVFLSYFVIALQFLFSQFLEALLIGVVCLWIVTTALLVLNQPEGHHYPSRSLKLSGRMLLHSLPLMALLFLIMPRIGSLWSMPTPRHSGVTGVSDSMSPGDFSNLSRSGGVAFRVSFSGVTPKQQELYWRGLVFSDFDGRRWQPSSAQKKSASWLLWGNHKKPTSKTKLQSSSESDSVDTFKSAKDLLARPVDYTIIFEPTQQLWLYSLMLASDFSTSSDVDIVRADASLLLADEPIRSRFEYSVSSHLQYQIGINLSREEREHNLQLPISYNPESSRIAKQWRATASDDHAYIKRVLDLYHAEFEYTLEPPVLGQHTVDEFLWQTKQGFCEHFASSFVVMMRAAGIPARVVAGYQGGEYNKLENYYVVHQYDAHAWTEVWLQDQGWVRFDPTAAVSPERIRQSLGDLSANFVESWFSLGRYRQFSLINDLRMQWDALNYRWHKSVMGFDGEAQSDLLADWLNGVTPLKMVLVVLGSGGTILTLMTLHLWWRGRPSPVSETIKAYMKLERILKRKGFIRAIGESPSDFAGRVSVKVPAIEVTLLRLTLLFEQAQYESEDFNQKDFTQQLVILKRLLGQASVSA